MPVTIDSFDAGLRSLTETDDAQLLQEIVKETLAKCPNQRTRTAKAEVAAILQRKYALETQTAAKHNPALIPEIDKKYQDLSLVLKNIPVMGMEATSNPTPTPSASPKLPVRPNFAGIGSSLIQSWFSKRKGFLQGTAIAIPAMCGLIYLYNKIWGRSEPVEKKVIDKNMLRQKELDNFEKMVKSLDHIRTFSRMSRNPDFSGDYRAVLKNPSKLKRVSSDGSLTKRLAKWNQEEQELLKGVDQAVKVITSPPKKYSFPSFLKDESPLPKPPKVDAGPIFGEAKKVKKVKVEKEEEAAPEPAEPVGKLIPISKRSKRVRKVEE